MFASLSLNTVTPGHLVHQSRVKDEVVERDAITTQTWLALEVELDRGNETIEDLLRIRGDVMRHGQHIQITGLGAAWRREADRVGWVLDRREQGRVSRLGVLVRRAVLSLTEH